MSAPAKKPLPESSAPGPAHPARPRSEVRARAKSWTVGERPLGMLLNRALQRRGGGDSEVFLALHPRGGNVVVRFSRRRGDDPRDPAQRERAHGGGPRHPNLVHVMGGGSIDGQSYVVREAVEGVPLDVVVEALAARGAVLGPPLVAMLGLRLARALDHLHRRGGTDGLVHGDVRPRNVILSRSGQVRLLDLGSAQPMGDAVVLAPRSGAARFRDAPSPSLRPEAAVDVHMLGRTLATLALGAWPSAARLHDALPELVPEVARFVLPCLAPPAERPSSSAVFARLIHQALPGIEGWGERDLVRALRSRGRPGAESGLRRRSWA